MSKKLFEKGFSLDLLWEIATSKELELLADLAEAINFSEDTIKKIKSIKEKRYIVASVETWCPYARAFTATIKAINKLNSNIEVSLITFGRGMYEFGELLNIDEDDYVIPTAILLDERFNQISSFIGYPKIYHENGFGNEKVDYFAGKKADLIARDFLVL